MIATLMSLSLVLAVAPSAPPPYPDSLACAAVTQAAAEIAKEANGGMPESRSFDVAMFWSFAVMDAAQRAAIPSKAAEADQKRDRAAVKPLLQAGDAATAGRLADCTARTPPLSG